MWILSRHLAKVYWMNHFSFRSLFSFVKKMWYRDSFKQISPFFVLLLELLNLMLMLVLLIRRQPLNQLNILALIKQTLLVIKQHTLNQLPKQQLQPNQQHKQNVSPVFMYIYLVFSWKTRFHLINFWNYIKFSFTKLKYNETDNWNSPFIRNL